MERSLPGERQGYIAHKSHRSDGEEPPAPWLPVGLATEWLARRSRQKSRLLPAATKLMSEKSASATFFQ
jgi:hypothetical protein